MGKQNRYIVGETEYKLNTKMFSNKNLFVFEIGTYKALKICSKFPVRY
jgi:hypothetical protein